MSKQTEQDKTVTPRGKRRVGRIGVTRQASGKVFSRPGYEGTK